MTAQTNYKYRKKTKHITFLEGNIFLLLPPDHWVAIKTN